jgi:copper chaperone
MQVFIHFPKEKTMIEMTLPDMSCGHCASTVTQTCKLVDPAAKVEVDISAKTVKIESAEERSDFAEALTDAGYPPAN